MVDQFQCGRGLLRDGAQQPPFKARRIVDAQSPTQQGVAHRAKTADAGVQRAGGRVQCRIQQNRQPRLPRPLDDLVEIGSIQRNVAHSVAVYVQPFGHRAATARLGHDQTRQPTGQRHAVAVGQLGQSSSREPEGTRQILQCRNGVGNVQLYIGDGTVRHVHHLGSYLANSEPIARLTAWLETDLVDLSASLDLGIRALNSQANGTSLRQPDAKVGQPEPEPHAPHPHTWGIRHGAARCGFAGDLCQWLPWRNWSRCAERGALIRCRVRATRESTPSLA